MQLDWKTVSPIQNFELNSIQYVLYTEKANIIFRFEKHRNIVDVIPINE